jgi:hypothetical protein
MAGILFRFPLHCRKIVVFLRMGRDIEQIQRIFKESTEKAVLWIIVVFKPC